MAMPEYLKKLKPLTDDILEGLIGEVITVSAGGVTAAGVILRDVSKRAIWVQWPSKQERFPIPLEDIITLSYDERVHHNYRNPNINFEDDPDEEE